MGEREARMGFLRKRALGNKASEASLETTNEVNVHDKQVEIYQPGGHINLFSEEEKEVGSKRDSLDYVREKNKEKEDYEKKVGLLKYLENVYASIKLITKSGRGYPKKCFRTQVRQKMPLCGGWKSEEGNLIVKQILMRQKKT